jgi:hypothetical protein
VPAGAQILVIWYLVKEREKRNKESSRTQDNIKHGRKGIRTL